MGLYDVRAGALRRRGEMGGYGGGDTALAPLNGPLGGAEQPGFGLRATERLPMQRAKLLGNTLQARESAARIDQGNTAMYERMARLALDADEGEYNKRVKGFDMGLALRKQAQAEVNDERELGYKYDDLGRDDYWKGQNYGLMRRGQENEQGRFTARQDLDEREFQQRGEYQRGMLGIGQARVEAGSALSPGDEAGYWGGRARQLYDGADKWDKTRMDEYVGTRRYHQTQKRNWNDDAVEQETMKGMKLRRREDAPALAPGEREEARAAGAAGSGPVATPAQFEHARQWMNGEDEAPGADRPPNGQEQEAWYQRREAEKWYAQNRNSADPATRAKAQRILEMLGGGN